MASSTSGFKMRLELAFSVVLASLFFLFFFLLALHINPRCPSSFVTLTRERRATKWHVKYHLSLYGDPIKQLASRHCMQTVSPWSKKIGRSCLVILFRAQLQVNSLTETDSLKMKTYRNSPPEDSLSPDIACLGKYGKVSIKYLLNHNLA